MRNPNSWIEQLPRQRLKPMENLAKIIVKHLDGILSYCRTKVRRVLWRPSTATSKPCCDEEEGIEI
jgi:hypothetical protein